MVIDERDGEEKEGDNPKKGGKDHWKRKKKFDSCMKEKSLKEHKFKKEKKK